MTTPRQQRIREWTALALLLIVALATTGLFFRAGDVRDAQQDLDAALVELRETQEAGIVRGYKTRATACQIIDVMGGVFEPGNACIEPEMTPYFRPVP